MRCAVFSAVLVAGAAGLLGGCHERPVPQKGIALQLPQGTPMRPHGFAAIKATPGAPSPFTKDDVASYFTGHNLPMNSGKQSQFQVVSLEFLTSKQVSERLRGVSTGLPDGDLVGFATLSGTFIFTGPAKTKPATFSSAYAAFDGVTGNLLMDGTLESRKIEEPRVR